MLHAKYQPNRPNVVEKKSFEWFLPYMSQYQNSGIFLSLLIKFWKKGLIVSFFSLILGRGPKQYVQPEKLCKMCQYISYMYLSICHFVIFFVSLDFLSCICNTEKN